MTKYETVSRLCIYETMCHFFVCKKSGLIYEAFYSYGDLCFGKLIFCRAMLYNDKVSFTEDGEIITKNEMLMEIKRHKDLRVDLEEEILQDGVLRKLWSRIVA